MIQFLHKLIECKKIWRDDKYYINTNVSIYYGDTLHHPTAAGFYSSVCTFKCTCKGSTISHRGRWMHIMILDSPT